MKLLLRFAFFISIGFPALSVGQEQLGSYDPDRAFEFARQLANAGKYGPAQDTLQSILADFPEYSDVENLLAKTYSWEGKYDTARRHFNRITSRDRKQVEVWEASVRNEVFAGNLSLAIGLAGKGLQYMPGNARLEELQRQLMERAANPSAEENEKQLRHFIAFDNAVEVFDQQFEPMVYTQLEYQYAGEMGKILPRLNYNYRFEISGVQYELDVYPKISKRFSGYLNYGFSDSEIFPAHRAGGELSYEYKEGREASLGMRYLDFRTTQATLVTASMGWYWGNNYLSARPFVSLFKDRQPGFSGNVLYRRYLKDANTYLGLRGIYGFNPELRQFRSGDVLLAETLLFVESQELQFEYQFAVAGGKHRYRAQLGVSRQEFVAEAGSFFWVLRGGIRYQLGL